MVPARRMPNMRRFEEEGAGVGAASGGGPRLDFYGLGVEEFYGLSVVAGGGGLHQDLSSGGVDERRHKQREGEERRRRRLLSGDENQREARVESTTLGSQRGNLDLFYGFYGFMENTRLRGLEDLPGGRQNAGDGAGSGGGGGGGMTEEEEPVPHLPSAWMEGVGKNGCCASHCQMCEGGFSPRRHIVGGRITGT